MPTPFCKKCGCISDDDSGVCPECGESDVKADELQEKKEPMDCAVPCNGVCRSCRKPVVWAILLPSNEKTAIDANIEHGGDVEIRANGAGKLYAKITGPDAERRKHVLHSETCSGSWADERSAIINNAIARMK